MLWQLEHGKNEQTIREQCRANKLPLPEFLANKPEIDLYLMIYWKAFWELSTCRNIGMGEGPIPWSSVDQYASRHRIFGDDFDRLSYIIKTIDVGYLEYRDKASRKKSKIGGKKPGPGKGLRSK